jgi:hypothetical protein
VATLLRLAQQRYVTDTVGDPFTLAPIVAVTFCGDHDVGQHDRPSYGASVGKAVREVVLAWPRGIAVAGWEHHQLRQRVRDRILSTDPESYDEFAVEALAMLGPDINDATENWLRQVAAAAPHRLQPAVESVGVALSMPLVRPRLLLDLTEAYYLEHPDPDDQWWGGSRLLDEGIRRHQLRLGIRDPQAAWFYGPFFRLPNTQPIATLAMINRMLNHAASHRVMRGVVKGARCVGG